MGGRVSEDRRGKGESRGKGYLGATGRFHIILEPGKVMLSKPQERYTLTFRKGSSQSYRCARASQSTPRRTATAKA